MNFSQSLELGKSTESTIIRLLKAQPETIQVKDVANDPCYQKTGIDLIWMKKNSEVTSIEVKGDSYPRQNFFFETISNTAKGTEGCFLYSQADWFYYLFTRERVLYRLPMQTVRPWFIENMKYFRVVFSTTTDTAERVLYSTQGSLVPIKIVQKAFPEIKPIQL